MPDTPDVIHYPLVGEGGALTAVCGRVPPSEPGSRMLITDDPEKVTCQDCLDLGKLAASPNPGAVVEYPHGRVIHVAGSQVQVGMQFRQRCGWCGAIILDIDLTDLLNQGNTASVTAWPPGSFVVVEGDTAYAISESWGGRLPEGHCGLIDFAITGAGR